MTTADWMPGFRAEYASKRAAAVARRIRAIETRAQAERDAIEAEQEIAALDKGARLFGVMPEVSPENGDIRIHRPDGSVLQAEAKSSQPRQFKDIALELLKESFPKPVKAIHVQQAAEAETGKTFHWKTAGMTLYRLKQDGKAERKGQNWFYRPPAQPDLEELLS